MLKNDQTYFKNIALFTLQDFYKKHVIPDTIPWTNCDLVS